MNRSRTLKIALFIAMAILLGNVVAISRDYQDSWVLEGLELSFLLFMITYAMAFFSEKRLSWMIALAVIGRCVFLLIPNLKYVWFQGTAIDQHVHYALANHVYNEGYISALGSWAYTAAPLMQLLFSIFSIVLNVSIVDSMKYLPVLCSPIYPLLTYVIVKKLEFSQGTSVLKYALFISSIPVSMLHYIVTGSQFGVLLSFLVLFSLLALLQKNDRRYWFIFIFFIFVLAATHSVSSVLLTGFLLIIVLLQKFPYFPLQSYVRTLVALSFASISVAWLMFPANRTFRAMLRTVFINLPSGITPTGSELGFPRLFELARVDVLGGINTFLVYRGAEGFLMLVTLAGLLILLKTRKQINDTSKLLSIFCWLLLLFIPIGFLSKIGGFRVLYMVSPLFPIFSGIFILYLGKKKAWIRAIAFSSVMLLATLQLYNCQPLIPSANVISKDLPKSEPIGYVNQVNSIYQRQMINFARDHISGLIAGDSLTRIQVLSLTGYNFSITHLVPYYPLDKNQLEQKYDCFLIHLPGKSGILNEQAEIRMPSLILEAIYNSSIVYTNGESYILAD